MQLRAGSSVQDRTLTYGVRIANLIVYIRPLPGEVRNQKFRVRNILKDNLGDFVLMFYIISAKCPNPECQTYAFDAVGDIVEFWVLGTCAVALTDAGMVGAPATDGTVTIKDSAVSIPCSASRRATCILEGVSTSAI